MNRFSFSSTSSAERRWTRRNRWYIGLGVGLVFIVFLGAGIGIWLNIRHKKSSEFHPSCPELQEDFQRFDCHPDRPLSKSSCLARNGCYREASDLSVTDDDLVHSSYLGVPSCYFPDNYRGYEVDGSITTTRDSIYAEFRRALPSGFPRDIKQISIYVRFIDDNQLMISIKDAKLDRFRPSVPILTVQKKNRKERYLVKLSNSGLLEVIRKSTKQTLFQTDISRLIYSDQFIQLSTSLPSEYVYGLGEHKEGILKSTNWTRYTLFNQGDLPVPHRNLYGSHPFYLVMEPGGEASGVFLLNSNAMDYVLQPTPALTFRTIGGELEFYLFLGPKPDDVVSQYTMLFGKPNFFPRWSLGFQLSRYGYFTLDNMRETLERNLAAGIPIDVQWNDIDFMNRYLDFTYDPDNFKGLPEFIDKLHKGGRRYIAMFSPGVSNSEKEGSYSAYDEGKRLDLFIKDAKGKYIEGKVWNTNLTVFPDFSNPQTSRYWATQFQDFHKKVNFDGAWIDMNEPLNFMSGSSEGCSRSNYDDPPYVPGRPYPLKTLTLCMSAKHYQTVHYNEHNLEAYREAKATHYALKEITQKRIFIISRASFAGQGVYSGHWSGDVTSDWDDLRYTIPAMLAFSLYGMPMTGSDICGFRLNTTEELCTRWQSLGAFYPFSRNHNDYDTFDQDPAAMGKKVIEATQKALYIRYYLLPYLYTLFYRNHMYGETVARPLFFEFPMDNETYTIEDQFLWGPALLIMPALNEGVTTINPYVPKGSWYELSGKERSSEGQRMELEANLTDINIFLRGGYILPAQVPGKTTRDSALNPFDILVALDDEGKAKGELYWDDGESMYSIDEVLYNIIEMVAEKNTLKVAASKKGYTHAMKLKNVKVYGLKKQPNFVTINGQNTTFIFDDVNVLLTIHATQYSFLDDLEVTWS